MKKQQKSRKHNCRLPVTVACPNIGQQWHGHTSKIGHDGIIIEHANCFYANAQVSLHFVESGKPIEINGTVNSVMLGQTDISFEALSDKQRQLINRLINPEWSKGNLLDCLLIVARHQSIMTFSDCVRLTSLIQRSRGL